MDAVESGVTFTVTRGGREIGQLIPLRRQRRFVARAEFAATSQAATSFDLDAFQEDQMMAQEDETTDRNGD